jgi:WD40 repeat protein
VWDADKGEELFTIKGFPQGVLNMAFSPDGKRIAGGSKVWDADKGKELFTLKGPAVSVGHVAFSADGKRIAGACGDGTVRVWDTELGQEALRLKGHTSIVTRVEFSADGKRIASASHDRMVKLWDAAADADPDQGGANPHNLFLLMPRVSGLEVEISGAANEKAAVRRIIWNWGDRTPESVSFFPARHRYERAGIYHVRVTSQDDSGKTSTCRTTVTVGSAP